MTKRSEKRKERRERESESFLKKLLKNARKHLATKQHFGHAEIKPTLSTPKGHKRQNLELQRTQVLRFRFLKGISAKV